MNTFGVRGLDVMDQTLTPVSEPAAAVEGKTCAPSPSELCPVCRQASAKLLLRAPDRLHGRSQQWDLVRCEGCSLVRLSHPPSAEEMGAHYTDAYDRLISSAGDSPARWKERKETLLRHKQAGVLLDMGCSSGSFLASMGSGDWKLHGIEMSEAGAAMARARCGAEVFTGKILDAPFGRELFDVITCFDVLEHLYEPRRVMEQVAKWLKPGGIFYVQVPNIDSAEARVFGTYWHGLELPRHLFHYSPASLERLANVTHLSKVWLETKRNQAVGTSMRYVWDDVFRTVGVRRTPVAYRSNSNVAWRVARKVTRMTALPVLLKMAPLVGGGEAIHAIFRKDSAAD